jgi:hypothetical protein
MGLSQGRGGEPPQDEISATTQFGPMRKRKPYQKPAFRFERVFETQALSCGKIPGHGTACNLNHKTS